MGRVDAHAYCNTEELYIKETTIVSLKVEKIDLKR